MRTLEHRGVEIHRQVFSEDEVKALRVEADRVAIWASSVCVRHLREYSRLVDWLSKSRPLQALLPQEMAPVRSILFDKTANENWPVAWHQDLTIALSRKVAADGYSAWSLKGGVLHAQPPVSLLESMVTARIHLDETTSTNGALMVIPETHLLGKIEPSSIASVVSSSEVHVCECGPGDVLLMAPLILHSSRRSIEPSRRRVIHFEYTVREALDPQLTWHEGRESIGFNSENQPT